MEMADRLRTEEETHSHVKQRTQDRTTLDLQYSHPVDGQGGGVLPKEVARAYLAVFNKTILAIVLVAALLAAVLVILGFSTVANSTGRALQESFANSSSNFGSVLLPISTTNHNVSLPW